MFNLLNLNLISKKIQLKIYQIISTIHIKHHRDNTNKWKIILIGGIILILSNMIYNQILALNLIASSLCRISLFRIILTDFLKSNTNKDKHPLMPIKIAKKSTMWTPSNQLSTINLSMLMLKLWRKEDYLNYFYRNWGENHSQKRQN